MKVRDLAKVLNKCPGRMPIVVAGADGEERSLSWRFHDDGDGWDRLSFDLCDDEHLPLDTDSAKLILDYCLGDPWRAKSFFSGESAFGDYELYVTWALNRQKLGGGFHSVSVDMAGIEERQSGCLVVMLVGEKLPEIDPAHGTAREEDPENADEE